MTAKLGSYLLGSLLRKPPLVPAVLGDRVMGKPEGFSSDESAPHTWYLQLRESSVSIPRLFLRWRDRQEEAEILVKETELRALGAPG